MGSATSQVEKLKATTRPVALGLLEIEILIYLLNSRTALGPYADSSKKKLLIARNEILKK
jgi:hypothetical protein